MVRAPAAHGSADASRLVERKAARLNISHFSSAAIEERPQRVGERIDEALLEHRRMATLDVDHLELRHERAPTERLVPINLPVRDVVAFAALRAHQYDRR